MLGESEPEGFVIPDVTDVLPFCASRVLHILLLPELLLDHPWRTFRVQPRPRRRRSTLSSLANITTTLINLQKFPQVNKDSVPAEHATLVARFVKPMKRMERHTWLTQDFTAQDKMRSRRTNPLYQLRKATEL